MEFIDQPTDDKSDCECKRKKKKVGSDVEDKKYFRPFLYFLLSFDRIFFSFPCSQKGTTNSKEVLRRYSQKHCPSYLPSIYNLAKVL